MANTFSLSDLVWSHFPRHKLIHECYYACAYASACNTGHTSTAKHVHTHTRTHAHSVPPEASPLAAAQRHADVCPPAWRGCASCSCPLTPTTCPLAPRAATQTAGHAPPPPPPPHRPPLPEQRLPWPADAGRARERGECGLA